MWLYEMTSHLHLERQRITLREGSFLCLFFSFDTSPRPVLPQKRQPSLSDQFLELPQPLLLLSVFDFLS